MGFWENGGEVSLVLLESFLHLHVFDASVFKYR